MAELEHIKKSLPVSQAEEKRPLLKNTAPDSSDVYQCNICKDYHFIYPRNEDGKIDYSRTVPCRCYEVTLAQEKAKHLLVYYELPPQTEHMTFEKFRVRAGLEEAYQAAMAVADGDGKEWLTLVSDTNRGKTHLTVAICRHRLTKSLPTRYVYVPLLMEELRRGFRGEGDESYGSRFDHFCNVPLLVMDDLGTESPTKWVQEKLDTIIDYRLMHGLGLVVTTNCPMQDMPFRIASRLKRNGRVIFIESPEYSPVGVKR